MPGMLAINSSNCTSKVDHEDDVQSHLEWLSKQGVKAAQHSSRDLSEHLFGVYELLKKWGNPKDVCLTGLFHSVYGTLTFKHSCLTLKQRPIVQQRIGERAERWVYMFATQNRDHWFNTTNQCAVTLLDESGYAKRASRSDLSVLIEIELANIIEQLPHRESTSAKTLRTYEQQIKKAGAVVSNKAFSDSENALRAARVVRVDA